MSSVYIKLVSVDDIGIESCFLIVQRGRMRKEKTKQHLWRQQYVSAWMGSDVHWPLLSAAAQILCRVEVMLHCRPAESTYMQMVEGKFPSSSLSFWVSLTCLWVSLLLVTGSHLPIGSNRVICIDLVSHHCVFLKSLIYIIQHTINTTLALSDPVIFPPVPVTESASLPYLLCGLPIIHLAACLSPKEHNSG